MKLKDQLYNSLPAGKFAFGALLRLLDVVETTQVPTAAVECRRLPRLLVNPDFVKVHANTPDKLAMLVLHELHHVLLGHTQRFDLNDPLENFVFDCVINAMLCRLLPNPESIALFTDYYSDEKFPECFLRPPAEWNTDRDLVSLPPALGSDLKFPGVVSAREVYKALYSFEGASYEEIRQLFPKALGRRLALLENVKLLGGHGDSPEPAASAELVGAIREVITQWPCPPEPFKGQSLDGLFGTSTVQIQGRRHDRQSLRRLFRSVANLKDGSSQTVSGIEDRIIQSPIRGARLTRKDLVGHLLGHQPLLLESRIAQRVPVQQGSKVHVYLDVSGSIEGIKGVLYGAVLEHSECVWPQIHLFSTEVADVSLPQLRKGVCKTTGGTDINCVFDHARKNRVQRALIVTDGWVGTPSKLNADWARQMKVAVAYTPSNCQHDLAPYARHSAVLQLHSGVNQ
jgi:hypothetical protein